MAYFLRDVYKQDTEGFWGLVSIGLAAGILVVIKGYK